MNALSGGNAPPPQAVAPTTNSRPHVLAGALSMNFPGDWREGTFVGSLLRNVGIFSTLRFQSGTAYTKCETPVNNDGVVSGQVCAQGGFLNGLNSARLPTFKNVDLKVTKGFGLGGLDLTAYIDARNVFNWQNILQVFVTTNDVVNSVERERILGNTLDNFQNEADDNGVLLANEDIDLTFDGDGVSGCANWVSTQGDAAAPSCIYLIRAEQRYGNGDGILSVDEQTLISDESYLTGRGIHNFVGQGRRLRLGFELNF